MTADLWQCSFSFFSAPEGTIYHKEAYGKYTTVCDGCGTKKQCNCFVSQKEHVIMDLCGSCQKQYMSRAEVGL